MSLPEPWLHLIVDDLSGPGRLDAWVSSRVDGLSRRRAAEMISSGEITVAGSRTVGGRALAPGESVEVWSRPAPERWPARPDPDTDLAVVAETELFIVINKPPGIPTTPRTRDEAGTLAGAIAARFPECAPLGRSNGDSGLLQRLDRQTSGLVVAARTHEAFEALWDAQKADLMIKTYLAVTDAGPPRIPPVVDEPLSPRGPKGRKMVTGRGGKRSITRFEVVRDDGSRMLVRATMTKGARHQIRAHLAHAGHPIVGDSLYGAPEAGETRRHLLHCAGLTFPHPDGNTGQVSFDTAIPYDLYL